LPVVVPERKTAETAEETVVVVLGVIALVSLVSRQVVGLPLKRFCHFFQEPSL
jgi:hypothetical protein